MHRTNVKPTSKRNGRLGLVFLSLIPSDAAGKRRVESENLVRNDTLVTDCVVKMVLVRNRLSDSPESPTHHPPTE